VGDYLPSVLLSGTLRSSVVPSSFLVELSERSVCGYLTVLIAAKRASRSAFKFVLQVSVAMWVLAPS